MSEVEPIRDADLVQLSNRVATGVRLRTKFLIDAPPSDLAALLARLDKAEAERKRLRELVKREIAALRTHKKGGWAHELFEEMAAIAGETP